MSQMKIIRQDVINSLKNNLNSNNIEELIHELENKSKIEIEIAVNTQGYNWYIILCD